MLNAPRATDVPYLCQQITDELAKVAIAWPNVVNRCRRARDAASTPAPAGSSASMPRQ